jgi:hypothetical protein
MERVKVHEDTYKRTLFISVQGQHRSRSTLFVGQVWTKVRSTISTVMERNESGPRQKHGGDCVLMGDFNARIGRAKARNGTWKVLGNCYDLSEEIERLGEIQQGRRWSNSSRRMT